MKKKGLDENGKTYEGKKPFYKKVWVWVTAIIVLLIIGGSIGGTTDDKSLEETAKEVKKAENTTINTDTEKPKTDSLAADPDFGNLIDYTLERNDVKVFGKQSYTTTFTDNSWAGLSLGVDKVSIVKTSEMTDSSKDKFNGFAAIHYHINNTQRDINLYPSQATIATDYGEQVNDNGSFYYDSNLDGKLLKGTKKDRWGIYPLEKLQDASAVKNIRLSMSANYYNTQNVNDENASHTYDISLQLQ